MHLPRLHHLLLSLLGPAPLPDMLAALDGDDWSALNAIAATHRLQPLLHSKYGAGGGQIMPANILASWSDAYRHAGLQALVQRRDLIAAVRILGQAGIQAVALKGAWLAWYAYPAPAQRPLRDLDLLVGQDAAMAAWNALREAGYSAPEGEPDNDAARRDKHLPALITLADTPVELHMRCWEKPEQAGHAMPRPIDDAIQDRARAVPGDDSGILYPCADDMFAHLAVHAAYSHWFDTGPAALVDIAMMDQSAHLNWPDLWQRGVAEGWLKGAALLVALTDRWCKPGLLARSQCPHTVPDGALAVASQLLLQPLERRAGARMIARVRRDGLAATLGAKIAEAVRAPQHFARLAGRRTADTLSGALNRDSQARSRQMRDLGAWLFDRG